ncbi:MAG: hypothetical protein HKM93_20835 [Desulfobacteraceae bacterium]|nr:hypothetical protein [Desulfobacteraceae bacterium]
MKRNLWIILAMAVVAAYLVFNKNIERDPMLSEDYLSESPPQANRIAPAIAGNLSRFHDKAGNYRIDYPSDWTLADHSGDDKMIRADIYKGDSVGFQIRIVDQGGVSFNSFVEDYIQRFVDDMSSHWDGEMTELSRDFGWTGGYQGCSVRMLLERGDGQRWFFKEYIWPMVDGSNRVVVLQSGSIDRDRGGNETTLDAIAESFRFNT